MGTRGFISPGTTVAMTAGAKALLAYTTPSGVSVTIKSINLAFSGTNSAAAKATLWATRGAITTAGTGTAVPGANVVAREGLTTQLGSGVHNYSVNPAQSTNTEQWRAQLVPALVASIPVNIVLAPGESLILWSSGSTDNVIPSFDFEIG